MVLAGGHGTGRRAAAQMLLRQVGSGEVHVLDPDTSPGTLAGLLDRPSCYVLCDPDVKRSRPWRENHLLALRDRLARGGYLVITSGPTARLGDLPTVEWQPPATAEVLRAHATHRISTSAWDELHALAPVQHFLSQDRLPHEAADFARRLAQFLNGEVDEAGLDSFGENAVQNQVDSWLTSDQPELRDKAFLVSLAVFDGTPYALAAELGDQLFALLQKTENPGESACIPVFGSSRAERLRLARASGYQEDEVTQWGKVPQYMMAFQDQNAAKTLLREVWIAHPSARPALVGWLRKLAHDGRPLVRARAAAATAQLAEADLPSAMALLIEPWTVERNASSWAVAANALTLAQLVGAPSIPRVLHEWCTGKHASRRWTAIRAYGLLGHILAKDAMPALLTVVRRKPDAEEGSNADANDDEVNQLAEATQVLLLAARDAVLPRLAELVGGDRAVRDHALRAFLLACGQTEEEEGGGFLVLEWYAEAADAEGSEDDRHLAALWRAALSDPSRTSNALQAMRKWVQAADQDPEAERALSMLLPALAASRSEHQRISHLLRTVPSADGGKPPEVANRLLTLLSSPRQHLSPRS